MPTGLFTRSRKISLVIAFVLTWPATWVAQNLYFNTSSTNIFSGEVLVVAEPRTIRRVDPNNPTMEKITASLLLISEYSGWPFASFVHFSGSYTTDYEYWESGWGALRSYYYYGISNEAFAQFKKTILVSDNQQAINVINGVNPPTGPRILGWIGNTFVWWILCYIGIALTLTLARGTDKATHIPKELVQQNRAEQGLCPHCAYDLRGLDENELCPECGKKPTDLAVSEAKKNPIADNETNKDDPAKVSCE